jgi:hypothetical protein
MEKLRELRDKADQRGQTNAAIRAEELRGQLQRFNVKQVETGDAGDFSRMSDEELRAYVEDTSVPPGETKHSSGGPADLATPALAALAAATRPPGTLRTHRP